MPQVQSPANIAILQFSLDSKYSTDKFKIVEGVEQLDRLLREQENHIKSIVVNLKKLGTTNTTLTLIFLSVVYRRQYDIH
jgi:hypothetical protein